MLEHYRRNIIAVFGFQFVALLSVPSYYLRAERLISAALCVRSAVEQIYIERGAFAVRREDGYIICSASVYAIGLLADAAGQSLVYLFKLLFVAYPNLPVVVAEGDGERDMPVGHGLQQRSHRLGDVFRELVAPALIRDSVALYLIAREYCEVGLFALQRRVNKL